MAWELKPNADGPFYGDGFRAEAACGLVLCALVWVRACASAFSLGARLGFVHTSPKLSDESLGLSFAQIQRIAVRTHGD